WVDVYLNKNYLKIVNSSRPVKNTDRLFDRYYKESQRGVGLGLSIVKKLASELGFSVQVNYSNNKFTAVLYF
ncbi:MAG: sensor histidine kinase, partial [Aquificae bacterium]|nr:sensor histidine kinase [Aquificota bacterium]